MVSSAPLDDFGGTLAVRVLWRALISVFSSDTFRLHDKYRLSTTQTVHGRGWIDGHLRTKAEEVWAALARVGVSTYCRNVGVPVRGGVAGQRRRRFQGEPQNVFSLGMRHLNSLFHGKVTIRTSSFIL